MSEIEISTGHPDAGRIYAEALDRVTAERDAALGREADLVESQSELREGITKHWQVVCDQRAKIDALQQRLTAAGERVDVLEGLLREWIIDFGRTHSGLQRLKDRTMAELRKIDAELKPAERRDDPNCLLCLDKKTVPSNLAEGYVMDCPDCCGEEG